jgi:hypothetical protein
MVEKIEEKKEKKYISNHGIYSDIQRYIVPIRNRLNELLENNDLLFNKNPLDKKTRKELVIIMDFFNQKAGITVYFDGNGYKKSIE